MKYKYKTKIYALFFIITLTFIVFYPKSMNFNINNVVADTESFRLKDGFETFIENKIYSEQENLTITEYFKDYYGDSCDFEEDTEDFDFQYESGTTYYDISQSEGILLVDVTSDQTFDYFTLMYKIDVENLSLMQYNYLEVRAKCDYTVHNPTLNFGSQTIDGFEYIYNEDKCHLTSSFQTFYRELDINEAFFHENITNFLIIFQDTDNHDWEFEWYDFEIDYIKIWSSNYSDFASEEIGDSWDFSENDLEGFISASGAGNSRVAENGKYTAVKLVDGSFIKERKSFSLDAEYYNSFTIRIYSNKTSPSFVAQRYDQSANIITGVPFEPNVWVTITCSFNENWDDDAGLCMRYATAYAWEMYEVDYILITHNNLEDKTIIQSQDTSFYRASSGLYSYHHNFDKNYTYYNSFSASLNSSVIIDIPTLTMFPQKVVFDIYSNSYFNISLFIGTEEFILYEKTNINSWLSIRKNINRENYLINETETLLYFKIYTENQFIENYLEYYIDNLEIIYTEVREQYEYYAEAIDTEYNDYWSFNTTNNNLFAEPSGVGDYAMGEDTLGCVYNITSNELFSRRAYNSFKVDISSYGEEYRTSITIYQYTTLIIDKVYFINTTLEIKNLIIWEDNYLYATVNITNELTIDGEKKPVYSNITIIDYFLPYMYSFEFNTEIVQEDYNTIRVSSNYESLLSGNSTRANPFSFEINTGDIKNAINVYSFQTYIKIIPSQYYWFYPIYPSNPTIIVAIERSITHSGIIEDRLIGDKPKFPVWDSAHAFLSIWNMIKAIFSGLWNTIVSIFSLGSTLWQFLVDFKDFVLSSSGFLGEIVTFFLDLLTDIGSMVTTLFSSEGLLGDIFGGILDIFSGVGDIFVGMGDFFSGFWEGWTEFWGNMWDFFDADWIDFLVAFFSGDWDGVRTSWGLMMEPIFDFDITTFWVGIFGGFFSGFFGFEIFSMFSVIKDFFEVFAMVSTILIVIYLIHLFKLVGSRDWDRFRTEASGIVRAITWLIEKSIAVIMWIVDMIIGLVNAIPFI